MLNSAKQIQKFLTHFKKFKQKFKNFLQNLKIQKNFPKIQKISKIWKIPNTFKFLKAFKKKCLLPHCSILSYFAFLRKLSMTRVLSFWAFAKRRKIHTLILWILRFAQYDKIYKFNKICKYDKNLEHKKRLRDYSLNLL